MLPRLLVFMVAFAILVTASCSHVGQPTFEQLTSELKVSKIRAKNHHLLLVSNEISLKNQTNVNIYLEGDGFAWLNRRTISRYPAPPYPLGLDLMSRDSGPALYLTRPCYYVQTPGICPNTMWTYARYSPEVVSTMAVALERELADREYSGNVTLIGYSGGATIALLLARKLAHVNAVVTVAGGLDTEAWIKYHKYSPLHLSQNPAKISLPDGLRYVHLAGSDDQKIPPALGKAVYQQPGHELKLISGFDHECCWAEKWPELLRELQLH